MEEVGLRGARTATHVVNPDIAFAIDVGIDTDTPGHGKDHGVCRMGKGPVLTIFDTGHLPHQGLLEFVRNVAEEEGISYQYEWVENGATDASRIHIHNIGVPALSLGVPARYIHSHASIIDKRDAVQLVRWVEAIILRLDRDTVDGLLSR
jgi:endoglucanase